MKQFNQDQSSNLRKGLSLMVKERYKGEVTIDGIINYLLESNIITRQTALRYIIKDEYYKRLKEQNANCFEIKLDLSIKYNVSKPTIDNIIYKYSHIVI